ncbi:MAG: hypothetical protein ACI8PQ_001111 [Planctomycetota bacterium]|jgi:hypothetical protein
MSSKLYVLSGKDLGSAFEVVSGSLIGRAEDCGIRLTDASISRQHARLEKEGAHWHLIDLGSRNGLHQGGERLERIVLVDHDEFLLGEVKLRFRNAAKLRPEKSKPAKPVDDDGGGLELEEDIDLESLAPKKPARSRAAQDQAGPASAGTRTPSEADERRAALVRSSSSRGGFLTDSLEDRPLWMTLLILLVVLGISSGLAYGVFRLVTGARGG